MNVRESYDSAATVYAEHLFGELEHKPLDRHLLRRFAEEVGPHGTVADLGCGPGQVARFLSELGVTTVGIDLSPNMIACASRLSPALRFQVGDMLKLDFADRSLSGAVAFYSIVHFGPAELLPVFREIRRVIADGGLVLLAFHIGEEVVHVEDLFGAIVSLDFHFHSPDFVLNALTSAGFAALEKTERLPYTDVEYPSRRCYVLARAT